MENACSVKTWLDINVEELHAVKIQIASLKRALTNNALSVHHSKVISVMDNLVLLTHSVQLPTVSMNSANLVKLVFTTVAMASFAMSTPHAHQTHAMVDCVQDALMILAVCASKLSALKTKTALLKHVLMDTVITVLTHCFAMDKHVLMTVSVLLNLAFNNNVHLVTTVTPTVNFVMTSHAPQILNVSQPPVSPTIALPVEYSFLTVMEQSVVLTSTVPQRTASMASAPSALTNLDITAVTPNAIQTLTAHQTLVSVKNALLALIHC
jgi:hypothetical protein